MANFTELYNVVANVTWDVPLDSLCDRARELIPPLARVWEVLAKLAVQSWDNEKHQVAVANGGMTANDFTDGNHAKLFINNLMTVSPDNYDAIPASKACFLVWKPSSRTLIGVPWITLPSHARL